MAAHNSASAFQQTQRTEAIAALRLRGASQQQIALRLKVNQSTVSRVLAKATARLMAETSQSLEAHRAVALAKLDAVQAAAWAEWSGQPVGGRNPRLLDAIVSATERQADLLGLTMPAPAVVIRNEQADLSRLSDDDLEHLDALLCKSAGGPVPEPAAPARGALGPVFGGSTPTRIAGFRRADDDLPVMETPTPAPEPVPAPTPEPRPASRGFEVIFGVSRPPV